MLDAFRDRCISHRSRAGWALLPRVEARRADAVQATHRPHRGALLVVCDEREDVGLGLEVNAMAFF